MINKKHQLNFALNIRVEISSEVIREQGYSGIEEFKKAMQYNLEVNHMAELSMWAYRTVEAEVTEIKKN